MTAYQLLIWVHLILFVYWLGADLGVFIAAVWARNATLSSAERAILLKLATVIDLTPRLAFVLMMPIGMTLGRHWGLPVNAPELAAIWGIAALWLIAVLVMAASQDRPLGRMLARLQTGFLVVAGAAFIAFGASLLFRGSIVPAWLAWKIILFGAIFFVAIGIDVGFRPVILAFGRLAAEGSNPEVEEAIRRPINTSLVVVSVLYLLLLTTSFLGLVKPDIAS